MISRIEATNYRCFRRLEVELNNFSVLAGANGSGKTTLLDIPILIGDLLKSQNVSQAFLERLNDRPPRATTLKELIFGGLGETFILALEAEVPKEIKDKYIDSLDTKEKKFHDLTHIRYEIRFEIQQSRQLRIRNEYLILFPKSKSYEEHRLPIQGENSVNKGWHVIMARNYGSDVEFTFEVPKKGNKTQSVSIEDVMLAFPKIQFESEDRYPISNWFFKLLAKGAIFYSPDWSALRTASPPGLPDKVIPNAQNLPWLAMDLKAKDEERFDDWVEHVKTALPQIRALEIHEREEDHHAYFRIGYAGGFQVTSSGLSDGTLRVLALTILPYLKDQPSILIVEEPEDGIHPRAIETVLQSLSSMYKSQVWISSHSPIVLANSKLSQVFCTRQSDTGEAEIINGKDHPRLKEWKGALNLGNLFAAGVLG